MNKKIFSGKTQHCSNKIKPLQEYFAGFKKLSDVCDLSSQLIIFAFELAKRIHLKFTNHKYEKNFPCYKTQNNEYWK